MCPGLVSYSCIRCPKVVKVRILSVLMFYSVGGLGVSQFMCPKVVWTWGIRCFNVIGL